MDPFHHHHNNPCNNLVNTTCCHSCYTSNLSHFPPQPHYHTHSLQTMQNMQNPHTHGNNTFSKDHFGQERESNDQATVLALSRRITALESTLRRQVLSVGFSLRDVAARTIQMYFRAFLVRRSRTLRQLKILASVKSSLNVLKMLVSEKDYVDSRVVSRKAMNLLLKVDSIRGEDSMIRDGKRSISRELEQFLRLIDGLSVKRNKTYSFGLKKTKTRLMYDGQSIDTSDFVGSSRDERGLRERTRARAQSSDEFFFVPDDQDDEGENIDLEKFRILNNGKIGSLPKRNGRLAKRHTGNQGKAKKSVTFAEDGDRSRIIVNTREPNSSEDGSIDEDRELVDNLCKRVQRIAEISKQNKDEGQEADSEDEEFSQNSYGEETSKKGMGAEGNYRGDDEDLVFPAPVPGKMESKGDPMTTRKALKIDG